MMVSTRLVTRLLAGSLIVAGVACNVVAGLDKLDFIDGNCLAPCDDGDPCTQNDCATDGVCRGTPAPERAACSTAEFMGVCVQGQCLPTCESDAVCDDSNPCTNDTCDPTSRMCVHQKIHMMPPPSLLAPNCNKLICLNGSLNYTVDDANVPEDPSPCQHNTCSNGTLEVSFVPNAPCGMDNMQTCNSMGMCGCTSDSDCTAPHETCGGGGQGGVCGCTPTHCILDGVKQTCGPVPDGCGNIDNCDGTTMMITTPDGVETDVDCGGDPSACPTRCGLGKHCNADSDCALGHCFDGVCCDQDCSQACQHCTAAGHCANIGVDATDPNPPGVCIFPHACDGAGNCKLQDGRFCTASNQCVHFCKANVCH